MTSQIKHVCARGAAPKLSTWVNLLGRLWPRRRNGIEFVPRLLASGALKKLRP